MKYSEAKKAIEALSSKYSVNMGKFSGYFNIKYKGLKIAYVRSRYNCKVCYEHYFKNLPFSNKLYMILSELAMTPLDERIDEKKYRVRAFGKYLNLNVITSDVFLSDNTNTEHFKTDFTIKEIDNFKQREDIPLDWDKVELEEEHD
ncbi:hypothetical protein [Lactiplantibacillus plantarum]|uniref:hypothetical protein n=1 Tax=Lactiplantibacillus plantarum TaxID=1590 RepID=UPI001651A444|nr:hypothetical protein [Lactiplantibacillus plantarum]